ncbi:MAG: hypothetical protein M1816_000502 [Peltula sp. TS41687]|nr:MAG: hypothetical protein M1816_000502 [Peltula sp. TS41687]
MESLQGEGYVARIRSLRRYTHETREVPSTYVDEPRMSAVLISLPLSASIKAAMPQIHEAWPIIPQSPGAHRFGKSWAKRSEALSLLYRRAADSFLFRQWEVALAELQPVVNPPTLESQIHPAPGVLRIADAPKGLRVKIWSLYLTLLQVIIIQATEHQQYEVASPDFEGLYQKIKNVSIWEEVVNVGYGGDEGSVDIEVVINLATLILKNPHDHAGLHIRLEGYLSHLMKVLAARARSVKAAQTSETASENSSDSSDGMFSPGEVTSMHVLIELYALHVLPRAHGCDRAREFLTTNGLLDEPTRATFLKALESVDGKEKEAEAEAAEMVIEKKIRQAIWEMKRQPVASSEGSTATSPFSAAFELGDFPDPTRNYEKGRRREIEANLVKQVPPTSQDPLYEKRRPHQSAKIIAFGKNAVLFTTKVKSYWADLLKAILFGISILLFFSRKGVRKGLRRIIAENWQKVKATVGMGMKVSGYT